MEILTYPLGQLQANCYILVKDNQCIVIDPGDSADFILEIILRKNLKLQAILGTHGHFDHVMAVGEMQLNYPVPFYLHSKDLFLIERLQNTAEHFLEHKPIVLPPQNIISLTEGELKIERFIFQIISTPGHTPGSCCFYFEEEQVLFTGDTLFKDGIGRTDFKYGRPLELRHSLDKIFALKGVITVYSGHGEETLLEIEKGKVIQGREL